MCLHEHEPCCQPPQLGELGVNRTEERWGWKGDADAGIFPGVTWRRAGPGHQRAVHVARGRAAVGLTVTFSSTETPRLALAKSPKQRDDQAYVISQ